MYDATFILPQLPGICPFQELSYKITIQQISPTHNTISTAGQAENIVLIGPKTVTGHRNVYEVVNSSLVVDAVYSVLVEFDTLAGNVCSNTTFGKQMYFENTPKVYEDCISFYPIWKQTYLCHTNCHMYKCQLNYKNISLLLVLCKITLDRRLHSEKDGVF